MKITVEHKTEGQPEFSHLFFDKVRCVSFSSDNPELSLTLWFSEDCKEVTLGCDRDRAPMILEPITRIWKVKLPAKEE